VAVTGGNAALAAAVVAVGVGCAACGSGGSPSKQSPPPSPPSPTITSPPTSAPASATDIPEYQPSTVVSKAAGSTVLHSRDPIDKVSAFYLDFVNAGGWQTVSKSTTPYSTSLTIKKPGKGASISIAPTQGGTVISISTYPMP
jgi:hypothetical protein